MTQTLKNDLDKIRFIVAVLDNEQKHTDDYTIQNVKKKVKPPR